MSLAVELADAVARFLRTAPPGTVQLPFEGEQRRTWAYWPTPARSGVSLAELDRAQVKAAHRLLAALLPAAAHARAVTIMGLEEVLDRIEGYGGDRRHSLDYWVAVFGTPGSERWGVRFEGHHVSVHATVVDDRVRLTPLFLGANPALSGDGAVAPLGPEERLGFELLHALTVEQRAAAVIAERAPHDIGSRNLPRLGREVPQEGLPLAALQGSAELTALLDVYLGRVAEGAGRLDPSGARFSWAGPDHPGVGHYYRIAGPRLLIELDNTQDGANHVHTVVRDPIADFGDDLLALHIRDAH